MNPLVLSLCLVAGMASAEVAPIQLASGPNTPKVEEDLDNSDSSLHYTYGHASGYHANPYHGDVEYHHSYGSHESYPGYGGYGYAPYHHAHGHHSGYSVGHHGHGYNAAHHSGYVAHHEAAAPYVAADYDVHHVGYNNHPDGFGFGHLGHPGVRPVGPHFASLHHGEAYGHDLVGPFHHTDGPFGPFGFYSNFYHH